MNKCTNVEAFARTNLGKSFLTFSKDVDSYRQEGMVVGFNAKMQFLICSTNSSEGWKSINKEDVLLIDSPLNTSFFYITISEIKNRFVVIESICLANLGRELEWLGDIKCMVIDYNKKLQYLIVSYTDDNIGWKDVTYGDVILINSPLNASYSYIEPRHEYWKSVLKMP